MFSLFDIMGHVANALSTFGSVFKDVLFFRSFLILSVGAEMFYDFNIAEKPLWTNIIWGILFALVNLYMVIQLLVERGTMSFTNEELKTYNMVFSKMAKTDYKKLIKSAKLNTVEINTNLVEENMTLDRLLLIFYGMASVTVKGNVVAILREGQFAGEMSFLTGKRTTAAVTTMTNLKYFSWDIRELAALMEKDDEIKIGLYNVFSSDLIHKLIVSNTEGKPNIEII